MTSVSPITEEDIAEFLVQNPEFFERQADLLASIRLSSPHGGRAISLQERQAEMLREKIKVLERHLMDMMRHGNENMLIADRMLRWVRQLLLASQPAHLPAMLVTEICAQFDVPQAAVRVWDVSAAFADEPFVLEPGVELRQFTESLVTPYCGVNTEFEAVRWLDDPQSVASLALLALQMGSTVFGMLVLASPDPTRFEASMGTDFLQRIGDLSSAALWRLCDAEEIPTLY